MTKTELQVALAAATEANKSTAGVFLETLSALAYKEIKKNGEFVLPGFGKLNKGSLTRQCIGPLRHKAAIHPTALPAVYDCILYCSLRAWQRT